MTPEQLIAEARALLESVADHRVLYHEGTHWCAICEGIVGDDYDKGPFPGHKSDCRLIAFLKATE